MRPANTIRFLQRPALVRLLSHAFAEPAEAAPVAEKFTEDDLEATRQEAYQHGFAEASRLLEKQLLEQRAEVAQLQEQTFRAVTLQHENLIEQFSRMLPGMACEALRRVLAGVVVDRSLIEHIVNELLNEVRPGPEPVEVSLSAADLQLLENFDGQFRQKHPQICFRADEKLQPGDCLVRSRFGVIDGRLATKVKTMEAALK